MIHRNRDLTSYFYEPVRLRSVPKKTPCEAV